MSSSASSAGQGDPYWYEWLVGLNEVVKLLDPDSGTQSVAFQVYGVKGWDDVVVQAKNGRRCYYQVKHTRAGDSLTFGDLVQQSDGESLLGSLFESWKSSGLNDGQTKCVLYTNRVAGTQPSSTRGGIHRPPLPTFIAWLTAASAAAESISDLVPDAAWKTAWDEWRGLLARGRDDEQLAFFRSLEIRTGQDDLDKLAGRIHATLARVFGVTEERVGPLFDALHRALRTWTTGHPPVTVEMLCSALVLSPEPKELALAPPPPAPFFPTRIPVAEALERVLVAPDAESIVFLSAEPGAGKTSVLSWLANRRADRPFAGRVALRFFCFEPIRPETPFIAPDASRVRPAELWFSLLTQLRQGLAGRLHELGVPIRNDLLTWQDARTHVLRLADRLGRELCRPFVIVVDGIDHAARAAQTMPEQSAAFFASLPGPDELSGTPIRLLVAGQPAETYAAQYPAWLAAPHARVRRFELSGLAEEDVRALYAASKSTIPADQSEEAVRLIQDLAKGSTLATVFAVAEAERVESLDAFAAVLQDRRLTDGLTEYYGAIWRHALGLVQEAAAGIDDCLVVSLASARRGVTPEFFADAFADWRRPPAWWEAILESLGPLLTAGPDGYRVRHNDIRVFLSHRQSAISPARRRRVASELVDYQQRPNGDRLMAHLQLLDLMVSAGRAAEWPRAFTVEWVAEGGAMGIDSDQLIRECEQAVRRLPECRDWSCVVPVACATQLLERLLAARDYGDATLTAGDRDIPAFLPSEASVRPATQWAVSDLHGLARDAMQLLAGGEGPRAVALLRRWLEGLDLSDLIPRLKGLVSDFDAGTERADRLEPEAVSAFEMLGEAAGRAGWMPAVGKPAGRRCETAVIAFERGYVAALVDTSTAGTLDEFFVAYAPRYIVSWAAALRGVATAGRWPLVRALMDEMASFRDRLGSRDRVEAAAWALQSGASADDPGWVSIIDEKGYGIVPKERFPVDYKTELGPYLAAAYATGWQRIGLDARDIADAVRRQYDPDDRRADHRAPTLAVFRVAALLGRVNSALFKESLVDARELLTPTQVEEAVGAMWGEVVTGNPHFRHRDVAARLAGHITDVCAALGGAHDAAALRFAMSTAESFPVDQRLPAIWAVLRRHGRHDLLTKWLTHWLAPAGALWSLAPDEAHSIASSLTPLADEIGERLLAEQARDRLRWRRIGYRDRKEYGFAEAQEWFVEAARLSPEVWRTAGWRLWTLCQACDAQGGDNRLAGDIRTAVSAAALRCGVADWWALIRSTLEDGTGGGWHDQTRDLLVDGVAEAVRAGGGFAHADLPPIWSLALAFSYWHDEADNRALQIARDALLTLAARPGECRPLTEVLALTPRSSSLELGSTPKAVEPTPPADSLSGPPTAEAVLETVRGGGHVLPSVAARIIPELLRGAADGREKVDLLLRSLGVEHASNWRHGDHNVADSLREIVRTVGDDQLWLVVDAIRNRFETDGEHRLFGVASNLYALALARAERRGVADLIAGLDAQLHMHAWLAGIETRPWAPRWRSLPPITPDMTWRSAAVRLLGTLFQSRSAEALTAALEGLHALVDADPAVIRDVFDEFADDWQRYWLLHAAEVWAATRPAGLDVVRPALERLLTHGQFSERLQSWIVLCRLADAVGRRRPAFPTPASTTATGLARPAGAPVLMYTTGIPHGHTRLSDRYSAAHGILSDLRRCGWDFRHLEEEIATGLMNLPPESAGTRARLPSRQNDLLCHPLRIETAVGQAISRDLSDDEYPVDALCHLAQGLLDNDEPWLQRCPPRRAGTESVWPATDEYSRDKQPSDVEIENALREVAGSLDVPPGWRTLSARVFFCSRKVDYVLHYWHETIPRDGLIRAAVTPMCPSGRSFLWWLGPHLEPPTPGGITAVTGYFPGGRRRLNHDHVEIHPPQAWRTQLGWTPDPTDPLKWHFGDAVVARYEQLHGPLRDSPRSPSHRQPVVDRWIVSDAAFAQTEQVFGPLRGRDRFSTDPFGDD